MDEPEDIVQHGLELIVGLIRWAVSQAGLAFFAVKEKKSATKLKTASSSSRNQRCMTICYLHPVAKALRHDEKKANQFIWSALRSGAQRRLQKRTSRHERSK